MKYLLESTDYRGRSVLAMAALGGNGDVFKQALKIISQELVDAPVGFVSSLSVASGVYSKQFLQFFNSM